MEMASSSAPTASYNVSVAQAVLTLSINAILLWLTTVIKSYSSSSSSARRRDAAPAPAPPSPSPAKPAAAAAAAVDLDAVLGLMGAGAESVGFEEAAALFEEEEATVEEARQAFAVFDRDGDGFIDAAELRAVLTSLGFESGVSAAAEAECQRMIDAYDEDKDGRIDFREFVKLMETSH
jgi:calmodulin